MIAKSHLFDCIDRELALTGKASVIDSVYLQELLSYRQSGHLIYFDRDGYPIDFKEEYGEQLKIAGERFGSKIITASDRVSFTEYLDENGARYIYAINICWWNENPSSIKLKLCDKEYVVSFSDTDIKLIGVTPNSKNAVLVEGIDVDVLSIENNEVILSGFGNVKITLFTQSGKTVEDVTVNGVKELKF